MTPDEVTPDPPDAIEAEARSPATAPPSSPRRSPRSRPQAGGAADALLHRGDKRREAVELAIHFAATDIRLFRQPAT